MLSSLAVLLATCTAPTAPIAPFAEWQLQQLDGKPLPATIGTGPAALQLFADTLDLRKTPTGERRSAFLVYLTRDSAGVVTRTEVNMPYTIADGRITIEEFACRPSPPGYGCPAVYSPFSAVRDGKKLFFHSAIFGSRLYRLSE